jgi:hypothetical protein
MDDQARTSPIDPYTNDLRIGLESRAQAVRQPRVVAQRGQPQADATLRAMANAEPARLRVRQTLPHTILANDRQPIPVANADGNRCRRVICLVTVGCSTALAEQPHL